LQVFGKLYSVRVHIYSQRIIDKRKSRKQIFSIQKIHAVQKREIEY